MNVRDGMQQVFISYSRKDIAFVRKLAGDLEKAGYDVWWDVSDLRGGDDWLRVIPTAIDSSSFFIVVLSPNAITSDWVKREYTQALSLRKKIIPIMFARSSVPFALNDLNYIDFTRDDYATNLKALLGTLGLDSRADWNPAPPGSCIHICICPASSAKSNFNAHAPSFCNSSCSFHSHRDSNCQPDDHDHIHHYAFPYSYRDHDPTANIDLFADELSVRDPDLLCQLFICEHNQRALGTWNDLRPFRRTSTSGKVSGIQRPKRRGDLAADCPQSTRYHARTIHRRMDLP
jgi:hypothetical protein